MKTLNRFLTFCITAGFVLSANAQEFYFGLQGGINFADFALKSSSGTDQLTSVCTGYGFGGIFGYHISENLSLSLEPMYLQKGGTQMATADNPNIDMTMSVLEIPLLIKASVGHTVRPYLKAGPAVGFILNSEAQTQFGGVVSGSSYQTYKADLNDVLGNVDLGLIMSAGVSFSLGESQLFIEGRYSFGLVDLYQGGSIKWQSADDVIVVEGNEAAELYNKGIQVMFGMSFPY